MPLPREFSPLASIDYVLENAINEEYIDGVFELLEGVRIGVAEGGSRVAQTVAAFAAALDETTRSSRGQLQAAHEQIGEAARSATLESYDAKRAQGRMAGPYRQSSRDAGGRMRGAIEDASFFRATRDGLLFGNTEILDRQARQWYRLNYGAGGAAGPRPRRFQVHWGGAVVASLGLEGGPSEPFFLPRGIWTAQGGGERVPAGAGRNDWFFPQSERGALAGRGVLGRPGGGRLTRGIRAWEFFDAGVETVARLLPEAYENVYREWFTSAQRGVGPLSRVVTVPVPRPRRLRSRIA